MCVLLVTSRRKRKKNTEENLCEDSTGGITAHLLPVSQECAEESVRSALQQSFFAVDGLPDARGKKYLLCGDLVRTCGFVNYEFDFRPFGELRDFACADAEGGVSAAVLDFSWEVPGRELAAACVNETLRVAADDWTASGAGAGVVTRALTRLCGEGNVSTLAYTDRTTKTPLPRKLQCLLKLQCLRNSNASETPMPPKLKCLRNSKSPKTPMPRKTPMPQKLHLLP
ncbi:Protein of unknown function [Gryllus bimaculatus]|nr:Protein of unknown function [Gryllus bimaculatus]